MITRILKIVILVPVAIILIVLSVANRHLVTLALNPFRPEDTVLSLSLPFFVFLLLSLMIGVLLGSAVTWLSQGKHRKQAREQTNEARKWREEAGKQRSRLEEMNTEKLISASR